jgi:hypothetical protein
MRTVVGMRASYFSGFALCVGLLLTTGCPGGGGDTAGVCLDTAFCLSTYCPAFCGSTPVNEQLSLCDTSTEPARCDCECITQVGMGGPCEDNRYCDPNASSLGTFCCTDASQCGTYLNRCVEDCSTYSSGGGESPEGSICQDDTECEAGLYCCRVPNDPANCDFTQDQSCTCLSTP